MTTVRSNFSSVTPAPISNERLIDLSRLVGDTKNRETLQGDLQALLASNRPRTQVLADLSVFMKKAGLSSEAQKDIRDFFKNNLPERITDLDPDFLKVALPFAFGVREFFRRLVSSEPSEPSILLKERAKTLCESTPHLQNQLAECNPRNLLADIQKQVRAQYPNLSTKLVNEFANAIVSGFVEKMPKKLALQASAICQQLTPVYRAATDFEIRPMFEDSDYRQLVANYNHNLRKDAPKTTARAREALTKKAYQLLDQYSQAHPLNADPENLLDVFNRNMPDGLSFPTGDYLVSGEGGGSSMTQTEKSIRSLQTLMNYYTGQPADNKPDSKVEENKPSQRSAILLGVETSISDNLRATPREVVSTAEKSFSEIQKYFRDKKEILSLGAAAHSPLMNTPAVDSLAKTLDQKEGFDSKSVNPEILASAFASLCVCIPGQQDGRLAIDTLPGKRSLEDKLLKQLAAEFVASDYTLDEFAESVAVFFAKNNEEIDDPKVVQRALNLLEQVIPTAYVHPGKQVAVEEQFAKHLDASFKDATMQAQEGGNGLSQQFNLDTDRMGFEIDGEDIQRGDNEGITKSLQKLCDKAIKKRQERGLETDKADLLLFVTQVACQNIANCGEYSVTPTSYIADAKGRSTRLFAGGEDTKHRVSLRVTEKGDIIVHSKYSMPVAVMMVGNDIQGEMQETGPGSHMERNVAVQLQPPAKKGERSFSTKQFSVDLNLVRA
jgi:hypothetical protein